MRYEDASQAGSFDNQSMPIARPDADALAAGSMGPASGNVITGAGTITGAAGADTPGDAPARIVSLQGAGGGSSSTDGTLQAAGQFGQLSMDGQGGYNYVRTGGAPDGGVDVFTYTLADANGDRASARLTITFGKEDQIDEASAAQSALQAGIVNLPAGVELSDIRVVGRDLVVTLPDGSLMTIPGGAVFVPQLVIGDVQVPPTNVAALLIDSEPQPAAGNPQSSGGNFAVDVAPLDPGVPLGDLLPPTQLAYSPPQFEEVGQFVDDEPEIFIVPDGGVQTEAAVDSVDESGLPARPVNEPAGSNSAASSETTTGAIVYSADDTPATIAITVNGATTVVTAVNQLIAGQYGNLTITSIADGAIGYSYTLRDNTSGNTSRDDFLVTVTDSDGDTDSATLRIDIVDDVPTARPDTDSIAAGTFGPATGNVITDAAAGDSGDSDTNAADTVGADNATLTSVTGFGGSSDSTFDASGNLQVNGQYGVLLIKANGDYSYTRNANTPGGVTDTFNYTLTDGDTDTSSSTLTISIGNLGVTVGPNATVLTDDDAVPGANGNPGGTGDDIDAQNLSGALSGSGGDGTLTFDLLTTGAPTGFTYVDGPNGSVLVRQVQGESTVTVLTVTINATTGAYSVTQNAAIRVTGADENNQSFTINYTVTDLDNSSAPGTLTINVDDDTPTISVTKAADASVVLTTQDADTIGAASDTSVSTANFGSVFGLTSSAGADGAAAPTLAYALGVASSVSGLTSHGVPINLYTVGGTIVGSTAASAPASLTDASVVFTVAVSAAGVVTLTQLQQVDHAVEGTTTSPFDDQFAVLGDGKITLTASSTITDRDGDPASDSETVDLGGNIRFADDGPDVNAAFVANTTIRIDETDGVVAAGGEVDPAGGNLGTVTVARATYLTVSDPHVSADAPTSYGYTLQLGAAGEGGRVSSGLLLSTTNAPIYLYNVGGTIVGSTALSAPASVSDGSVAFTVSLNASGDVTLTQILAIEHGMPGSSHDEDSSGLTAGALSVLVKATDFDGDTDTAMVDLGSIVRFEDDGPAIDVTQTNEGGVLLTTQDAETIDAASDTDVSMASFSNVFAVSSSGGSDGTASVNTTYALAVTSAVSGLMSHGVAINLYHVGGTIVGSTAGSNPGNLTDASIVFTVAVNGSGVVTLTQLQQVDHAVEGTTTSPFDDQFAILADGKISLTASSTITDNDGDTATDSEMVDLGGNLRFADDGPTVTTNVEGPGSLFVSDADFSIDDTGNFSSFFNFDFGADGPAASASITYTLGVNNSIPGGTGLSDTLTKLPVTLAVNPANGNVVGIIQTSPGVFVAVFAVSVDASGNVTLNQFRAVYHSDGTYVAGADSDAPETLLNNGSITLTAKATDFDGDTASQTVGIGQMLNFGDDFPAVDITVVDDAANFLITQDADTIGTDTDIDSSGEVFNGAFSIVSEDFGNDGERDDNADWSLSLKVAEGTVSGLTSGGVAIRMYIDANGLVIGSTAANEGLIPAGDTIFTIGVDEDGVVTLSQIAQIDHTTADPSATAAPFVDHVISLPDGLVGLDVTYTITDGDLDTASDSASLDLGGNIRFADDGPSITASATAEGGVELRTQDADTIGALVQDMAQSTANFSNVFSAAPVSGADSPAGVPSWAYALSLTTGTSGLMSHGVAINLYDVGGTIVGSTALSNPGNLTDASIVFTVGVDNGGIVTLTQLQQIDHAVEGTTTAPFAGQVAFILNDNAIQLTGTATVTDFDGDTATDSTTIGIANNLKFDDDGPDVSAALVSEVSIRIDETDGVDNAAGETDVPGGDLGTVTVDRSAYVTVSDAHVSADAPTSYSYTLQLGAAGGNGLVASGLLLSTNDNPIYLYDVGGTVVGSTALAAPTLLTDPSIAFTVAINSSGDITLTQILAVEHGTPGASHDEDSSGLAAGALSVVVKATDFDGDTDTAPVDLGSIIRFEDDGPSINVAATGETGVTVTTQDADTIGTNFDFATSSAAFGNVFTIASASGGSDGAATTPALSYALGVPGAGVNGVDSGLDQGANSIFLHMVGGKVVGSTSATLAGVVEGTNVVFDVAVSSGGVVTLTQYSQINHPVEGTTTSPFDDQLVWMADGLVTLTASASIADNDADTASDSETIFIGSNLRFADDGPLAIADTNTVTEGASTSGNVLTDGADDSFGADGMGSIQGVAAGSSTAAPVTGGVGDPIVTSLGTLTLLADGGYTYVSKDDSVTTTQIDSFVYTIVDADGDTSTVTLQITINPVNLIGIDQTKTVNEAAMDTATTFPDVASGSVTGSQPGLATETVTGQLNVIGAAPTGYVAQNVTTAYGKFVLNTDGSYTYTLTAPFDGPTLNNGPVTHPAVQQFTYTVFDANGNSTTGQITIDVIDDIPSINVTKGAEVGVLLATQDAQTIGVLTDDQQSTANFGSVFGLTFVAGADGAVTPALSYALGVPGAGVNGVDSGLDQGANAIYLHMLGGKVVGSTSSTLAGVDVGTNVVFDVAVNSSGQVTLTQYSQLNHPIADDLTATAAPFDDQFVSILDTLVTLTASSTITDNDGDQAPDSEMVYIGENLRFYDDGPTINVTLGSDAGISLTTQDTETDGTLTTQDSDTTSFAGAFGLSSTPGADGAAAPTLSYSLGFQAGDSGLKSGGATIYLYKIGDNIVGSTAALQADVPTANTIFEVSVVGSGTGAGDVTLTQYAQIDHTVLNPSNISLADGKITLIASSTITDFDGDTATDSETLSIGANLVFQDDVPDITAAATGTMMRIDETDGVAAAGGEVDPAIGTNLGTVTLTAAQLYTVTNVNISADAPTTLSYKLVVVDGTDTGLDYSSTNASILLYKVSDTVVEGRVGSAVGAVAFRVSIDAGNGETTLTQFLAVEHGTGGASHDEDSIALAANALQVEIKATDFDTDFDTALVDLGSVIRFEDDGPSVLTAQNINIQNSGDVAHTGAFAFNLGVDSPNPGFDDIKNVTMTINVNGTNVTATPVGVPVETLNTATYTYSFTYATNSTGGTAANTVVVTFDKAGGTYTVDLASPIQAFTTINSTAGATVFNGYNTGVTDPLLTTNSQPDVVNVQLRVDNASTPANESLWVRLTGLSGTPGTTSGDMTLTAGEFITGGQSWVSASNTANGVGGDIVNSDEVLNIELFTSNQVGDPDNLATASASAVYFKLDNIGNSEDFVVNLKLWNDVNSNNIIEAGEVTTRAVYVANGDMIKGGGAITAGPGQYSGVPLDNNDALVIIENNDFNFGTENYRIIGAQIATTDQGISGAAIDLNGAIGVTGFSTFDDNVNLDSNNLGFKIQDIGFVSQTSTAQPATFTLAVTVGDADGDTTTQTLVATVTAAGDSTSTAAPAVVPPVVLDLDGDGVEFLSQAAGVAYDYNGDGVLESTGWVGEDDGILVRDANGNGSVDNASEFVFGNNGETDLQALAAQFGSALDGSDLGFGQFGVWQDVNSNGIAEAGELQSLTALGITSVSLTSDGVSYVAAGGDVTVSGSGTFTRADGSVGTLADASFATSARTVANDTLRLGTAANNNAALAAAIAAVGLAAAPAAGEAPEAGASSDDLGADATTSSSTLVSAIVSKEPDTQGLDALAETDAAGPADALDQGGGSPARTMEASRELADPSAEQDSPSELSAGTDAPAADVAVASIVADAIPSAEHLIAAAKGLEGEGGAADDVSTQLGDILADALAGGEGNGPTIDALLDAVAESSGAANPDAGGSSPALSDVSMWHGGSNADYGSAQMALSMDAMESHPDAVQAAA